MNEPKAIKLIERYEDKLVSQIHKLESIIARYETSLEKLITAFYHFISQLLHLYEKMACRLSQLQLILIIKVRNYTMMFYPIARYTTIPVNKLWIMIWKMMRNTGSSILNAKGMHFFVALQGGGKSSLIYDIIEEDRLKYAKASYINVALEKPRLDEQEKHLYVYHKQFELEEFWGLTKKEDSEDFEISQKKQFNSEYFVNLVFDEWLANMNHRMNKTKDYNNIFIALISSLARMRHQDIRRVLIASQLDTTDTQMMHMFKYIHQIEVDLDIDYWDWVKNGMFVENIIGWHIWTYSHKRNRKKGTTELTFIKKHYRKKTADFTYYNSLNQAKEYNSLPMDKI